MADRTQSSIEIAAEPEDVSTSSPTSARYPEWAHEVKSATLLTSRDGWADQVEFGSARGPLGTTTCSKCNWNVAEDGTGSVILAPRAGQPPEGLLNGTYTLDRVTGGAKVTYDLEVELTMPMIGLLKLGKHIINLALSELKKHVEG